MLTTEDSAQSCLIIGAGPAGLTAAYEAMKLGLPAKVIEKDEIVGGISRTGTFGDYRFDIGGHRFFTKLPEIEALWREILGSDLLVRPRLSRIYYRGKFFDYPIKPVNALLGLGPIEAIRIALSYAYARIFPSREERTFEQWVSNRFGRRLYEIFFQAYTEKIWGMKCNEIGSDWAAQRIKDLDLVAAIKSALLGSRFSSKAQITSLIEHFLYPRLGPGMMWERCRDILDAKGYPTITGTEVTRIRHSEGRVVAVGLCDREGPEYEEHADEFISSMPIRDLLNAFDPAPPDHVLEAVNRLRYRDFLTVGLIIDRAELFPDNWIYVHEPEVKVGRIQNFKNWSPEMVPDPRESSLGLEYFVQEGDELWTAKDEDLIALGARECQQLGLIEASEVIDGTVLRIPKAYPVYDDVYKDVLSEIRQYLDGFENLQLVGRNGQHRYNNQDHSMATALCAVRNINGADYDTWDVNVEESYHEEVSQPGAGASMDRLVPQRVSAEVDRETIRAAFARYDPIALGGAVATLIGLGLALATSILLISGGDPIGPNLSLVGRFLPGYYVSWAGVAIGAIEASIIGFLYGFMLAHTVNIVIGLYERRFLLQSDFTRTLP
jgi:protoporphyrinogen oxidase